MLSKQKIWFVQSYDQQKAGALAAELNVSPLLTGILLERGLTDLAAMREFLYGSERPFHDPFLMKDMQRAAERIAQAVSVGERLTIYGDYDVDGITASSLLYLYLKRRGAHVDTYIPTRKNEGYGLNDEALKFLAERGTTLVVTVDCGISGLHEVTAAPKQLEIIITDHHTVPPELPPALAVVDPKQSGCTYPFKDLSGVGIAFKLCQALEKVAGNDYAAFTDYTELAALGTVADIVPLLGENRELVRRGLKAMETTLLVGLRALIQASGCPERKISAENIGFILAPRLNAVGRLEHAQKAVELLVAEEAAQAKIIAQELNSENARRQEISHQIQLEAEAMLASQRTINTAIMLASSNWHPGVIGIVASRLVDKYHLPTLLFSVANGVAKGSCRSIPALNLYDAIAAQSTLLTQFGGHAQAAGLTLPESNLPVFCDGFRDYVAARLKASDYLPQQRVDCSLGVSGRLTLRDLEELALLEPCGAGNQSPVLALEQAKLRSARSVGREQQHLQFTVTKGDYQYKAVMWQKAELLPALHEGSVLDVAFMPRKNTWQEETTLELHAVSLRQALTLYDYRAATQAKEKILHGILQTCEQLVVLAAPHDFPPDAAARSELPLVSPEAPLSMLQGKRTLVIYSLPLFPLQQILQAAKEQGVTCVVLLYRQADLEKSQESIRRRYPDRDSLSVAYKILRTELSQGSKPLKDLQAVTAITPEALQIFDDLALIRRQNDSVTLGSTQRTQLEKSPLYRLLTKESQDLQRMWQEALAITGQELLRHL